jgi:hypothetical protein
VNANIRVSNGALDLQLRRRRCGQADHRSDGVHLGWRCADEGEWNGVLSWIAALHMRKSIIGMSRQSVMLMDRQPMVVLRMIVIVVGMRVQR